MHNKKRKALRIAIDSSVAASLALSVVFATFALYNMLLGARASAIAFACGLAASAGFALAHIALFNTADTRSVVSALGVSISTVALLGSMQMESKPITIAAATVLAVCAVVLLYSLLTHAVKVWKEPETNTIDTLIDYKHSLPYMLFAGEETPPPALSS